MVNLDLLWERGAYGIVFVKIKGDVSVLCFIGLHIILKKLTRRQPTFANIFLLLASYLIY